MHQSVLVFRNFLYLKMSAALIVAAVVAYLLHEPLGEPNGGTWLGYTLGTIGALLIAWLAWFGIRKRRYGVGKLLLEDWLSAHIYLGLSLVVVATLHTGFQFGWNVHTLAYTLMILVIATGAFGLYTYVSVPTLMAENREAITFNTLMGMISEVGKECHEIGVTLGDEINELVRRAVDDTRVGGGVWRQLSGRDPNCPTNLALERVGDLAQAYHGAEADAGRRLVTLLARKNEMLKRARRDVQCRALLTIWLGFHIPLTMALLGALIVHVVSVFFYW